MMPVVFHTSEDRISCSVMMLCWWAVPLRRTTSQPTSLCALRHSASTEPCGSWALPPWLCVCYHFAEQEDPGPSERGREEAGEQRHPLAEKGSPQEGRQQRVWGGHRDTEDSISHTRWAEGGQREQQWAQQWVRTQVHSHLGAGGAGTPATVR